MVKPDLSSVTPAPTRGRLRIFFGYAPGVGKTTALLADARLRHLRGADVVIGVVNTHGFADLEALCRELATVGSGASQGGGDAHASLDLDAVLARHPQIVLIDDIAQSNPEGSRHSQRWLDAEEILAHGIDVHATLGVQNLESLREAVRGLCGIHFRQTVADSLFEGANEVVLIDCPPAELLERLDDGKVHLEQGERMRLGLFQPQVLAKLRQLALRQAAARLEMNRSGEDDGRHDDASWQSSPKVLVCIDHTPVGEKLIQAGRRLAANWRAGWVVVYHELSREQLLPAAGKARIQSSLQFAEENGAEVLTLNGYNIAQRIVELARERNVAWVVLARPSGPLLQRQRGLAILRMLQRKAPELDVLMISPEHTLLGQEDAGERIPEPPPRASARPVSFNWRAFAWTLAIPAATTLVATLLFERADSTVHLILYLLGVLYVASRFGFWHSAAAAVLSLLATDYFLIRPFYSFAVARTQDTLTLGVFLLAALAASSLTAELRFQGERARQREQRLRFLYEFAKALAGARTVEEVGSVATRHITQELPWKCRIFFAGPQERLLADADAATPDTTFDLRIAQREFDNRHPGHRRGSTGGADSGVLYLALAGSSHRYGVLALRPNGVGIDLFSEFERIAGAMVTQICQAMERARMAQEAMAATARVETESLRNSMLSAIAHDFRTPLASIVAASGTLLQGRARLSDAQSRELAQTILDESERMTRLANNTLEMARLESGGLMLRREWFPLDELVGAAITRVAAQLRRHVVEARVAPPSGSAPPAGVAIAFVDDVTIVQVLENLLENAVKYTPAGTRIEIGASASPGYAEFWVADEGPGVKPGDERRIFEKFYRGSEQSAQSGVGLGLTICEIIVRAHGGQIFMRNRPSGGAEFRFSIPHGQTPPPMAPE